MLRIVFSAGKKYFSRRNKEDKDKENHESGAKVRSDQMKYDEAFSSCAGMGQSWLLETLIMRQRIHTGDRPGRKHLVQRYAECRYDLLLGMSQRTSIFRHILQIYLYKKSL